LIGTLNRFAREDPNDFGSWYHGKLYVNAPLGLYEGAVDVSTPSGVGVEYRVLHQLSQQLFAPVLALSDGWHVLAQQSASGALDYVRSPLLARRMGCITIIVNPFIEAFNRFIRSTDTGWVESNGDNALNALEVQLNGATKLYVFGAPYNNGLGVHDIHMNQGDPPGRFQALDGIWQDGGVIVERPGGELVAFLVKFKTQSFNTDNNGLPI